MPSNRAPSPLSGRPNPNSRNSETNSNIRRSFSGNPFGKPSALTNPRNFNAITPANSPADHLRRQSLGNEGGVNSRVHDEKENEKAARVRSPAKGGKNFMSPTISAASKFAPSPRKKVLAERNEPIRTSVQFSDCVGHLPMEDSDLKLERNEPVRTSVQFSDCICHPLMEDSDLKPEMVVDQAKLDGSFDSNDDQKEVTVDVPSISKVTLDSEIIVNSPIIAPLDADPSCPPYDPKTNFLSPRPQFLHYKPNPRIEIILSKEKGGGLNLEDSFILSENLSDTDVTGESQSEDSQKESEDLSSAEMISEEEDEPIPSEPTPLSTPISDPMLEPVVEAKISSKPRYFTRATSVSLLMVFLIACASIYVTDSPVIDTKVFSDARLSTLYDPSAIADFAKSNCDGLARSFRQWSANSISYVSGLLVHFSQGDDFGPIQFANLTIAPPQDEISANRHIGVSLDDEELEESYEYDVKEQMDEGQVKSDLTEEIAYDEEDLEGGMESETREEVEEEIQAEVQNSQQSFLVSVAPEILPEKESTEVEPAAEFQVVKPDPDVSNSGSDLVATDLASSAKTEPMVADTMAELSSEIDPSEPLASPQKETYMFSAPNILGISLLAVSLVAATVFICVKKQRNSGSSSVAQTEPLMTEKAVGKQVSQNWKAHSDEVADSCPSEMSSFQKSTSYSKRLMKGVTNEAQSHEKRPRNTYKRESLASSSEYSMGSPSYGSFTTYERIPIKRASGEEEIVTPVRRSSRIHSHVTSS